MHHIIYDTLSTQNLCSTAAFSLHGNMGLASYNTHSVNSVHASFCQTSDVVVKVNFVAVIWWWWSPYDAVQFTAIIGKNWHSI